MRTHAEWNVDTHIFWATGPTSRATRSLISPAALLVNVIARISNGETLVLVDEVGDAVREHPRLARAGAGDDEQRPVGVGDGLVLGGVETVEEVVAGHRGNPTGAL